MAKYLARIAAAAMAGALACMTLAAPAAAASVPRGVQLAPAVRAALVASRPGVHAAGQAGGAIMPGFSTFTLPGNDDGSTGSVPLNFPIGFYGHTYSSLYVNNNGNLTFGTPLRQYTPQSLNQLGIPMIAPFWADVDTRTGPVVTYGYGTVGGHRTFGANWLGVGCYAENTSVADYFQVLLISRPDLGYGNFDIEFNYGPLNWDSGQASGGNGQCLGGTAARAGYTSGFGNSYELPGSGVDGGLLSSNPLTGLSSHSMSSSQAGRYLFAVRDAGSPNGPSAAGLGDSYSSGEGTFAYNFAGQPCDRGSLAWPSLMSQNYPAAPRLTTATFYACSGDTTTELKVGKKDENPPQLTALKNWAAGHGSPSLVTLTVGGDDLGFKPILTACYAIGAPACLRSLNKRITYLNSGAFTPILTNTYDAVQSAAGSSAQIVVVGYPFIFPTPSFAHDLSADLHCPWLNGDAGQVLARFQTGQLELDSVMSQAAAQAGVQFVPLDDVLAGHELCTGHSYINDLSIAGNFTHGSGHPNLAGQTLIAQAVAHQLGLLPGTASAAQRRADRHAMAPSESAKAKARAKLRRSHHKAGRARTGRASTSRKGTAQHRSGQSANPVVSSALPDGQVSIPYSGYLWADGGTAPYSWSITTGNLPDGLSLDPSTGIITGTPTTSGTSIFTVTVTDASSQTAMETVSITVNAVPPVTVQTSQLASATAGQQYSASLTAAGGIPPYTWSVSSGSLPAGLNLNTSSGAITGTPTTAGSQTFTVSATDSSGGSGSTGTAAFTLKVASATSPLALTAPQLPSGVQGTGYTGQLTATGGTAPLYWTISSGSLPDGLSLDPGTGQITGIPVAAGTFSFSAQVVDASSAPQSAAENLSITIAGSPPPAISSASVPDGTVGTPYEQTVLASGGVAPYSWSVSSGILPDGLSLDPQTGTISGTPNNPGTSAFDVSLSDSSTPNPQTATVSLSITIAAAPPPPAMSVTDTATDANVGDTYNAAMIPSGGTGPYSFTVSSGALPDGLSLDPQAGTITGSPTTAGTYTATVQVTDSSSPTPDVATDDLSITIQQPGQLSITTSSLPDAAVGAAYAQPVDLAGGTGADTFSITSGSLPDGLSLDPNTGIITGSPTGTGTASFTVSVSDSATPTPGSASADLTLTTDAAPALTIPAATLPDAVQGVSYSEILAATGGTPPYTWSVSSGSLPDGLSLDPSAGTITGKPTGSGSSSFTVQVTDSAGSPQTATQDLTLNVEPTSPLSVTTSGLDPATQGSSDSATLESAGGTSPVTWSVTGGSLPQGLTLDPSGVISGTPTSFGTSYFTVQATDSSSTAKTATADLALEVVPLPVHTLTPQKISFTAPAAGLVGSKAKLSATGGPSGNPVNFTVDGASRTGVCSVSGTNGTTLTYKAAGSCIIDATQAGNGTYAAAPQIKATIPVGRASKTALSLSSSTATYGKETKLVFTVKVTAKTGKPTGTVQVITGATQLCTATLSKGKATCKLASATTLATGKYKVHAAYSGNTVFAPSVSGAKTLTVK